MTVRKLGALIGRRYLGSQPPCAGQVPPRARGGLPADLGARVAVAVPTAAILVLLVLRGGWLFAAALAVVAALGQAELARMLRVAGPGTLPGLIAVAGAPLIAQAGGRPELLALVVVVLPVTFLLGIALGRAEDGLATLAVNVAGVAWIGLALGHGVLLRELPHGGGLVIDVLLATFLGDTAAHLVGSAWGRRRLAPDISPNKTVEGLAAGVIGGTAACWLFATAFQDWLPGLAALALGLACALAAPVGDLLESRLKREAGVKDSGRLFGAHGGVLDRADAVLAAAVVGYYVALAVT